MRNEMKKIMAVMIAAVMTITAIESGDVAFAKAKSITVTAKQVSNKKTVKITWKKYSSYKNYKILKSTKKNSGYKKIASVSISGKTGKYLDTKTKYGATYYYKIKINNNIVSKAVKVKVNKKSSTDSDSNAVNESAGNGSTISGSQADSSITSGNSDINNSNDSNNNDSNNSTQQPEVTPSATPEMQKEESLNNEEMPTPVPIVTMAPVKSDDISEYGTENSDYYIIQDNYVSSDIADVATIDETSGNIVLNSGATLVFEGSISDRYIVCDAKDAEVTVILNGADINVGSQSFIKTSEDSCNVKLVAMKGSTNIIKAGELSSGEELVNSAGNLTLAGEGILNITNTSADSNTFKAEGEVKIADISLGINCVKKAIVGKPVKIESGNVDIVSSEDDGIKAKGKEGFLLSGGKLTIKAKKDGINSNRYVQITDGYISIVSEDDGIQCGGATFDETAKEFDIDAGTVNIYGGEINIESSGAAVKANQLLNISDGKIYAKSAGKGLKAGAGYEYPEGSASPEYTAVQNGYLNIFGGTIEVHSASHAVSANGNSADIDNDNAVVIKGGTLILEAEATYSTSSQSGSVTGGKPEQSMGSQRATYTCSGADGIQADTGIFAENASIVISKCADGIQAESNLYIHNVNIDISAYGKGLKAGYVSESDKFGELTIQMGNIAISSFDDCVHCNNNIKILEGELNITTADDGVHADNDLYIGEEGAADDKLTINVLSGELDGKTITPYEGIEGAYINVLSGNMSLLASDDGINAAGGNDSSGSSTNNGTTDGFGRPNFGGFGGGMMGESQSTGELHIAGGNIYINAQGDSVDSNGKIEMTGGYVKIDGSDNGSDDVIDFDGTFNMMAGTVIAVGKKGVSTAAASSGSGQNNVLFTTSSNISAGSEYKLVNEASETILSGTTLRASNVYFFSDSRMTAGTYSLYINGTKRGTVTFQGTGESKSVSFS